MSAFEAFNPFSGRPPYLRIANCFAPTFTLRSAPHSFRECLQFRAVKSFVSNGLMRGVARVGALVVTHIFLEESAFSV